MLRPTRSWTSRAEAVAAKDKCLRHWIFWNLVLRKGLPHTVAVVIVKLAVPDGSRHAPFEPFAGNPADRVSAAVQSTSEGAMAAHNPVFPDCIPAVHPAARSKAKVGWMMSKYGLDLRILFYASRAGVLIPGGKSTYKHNLLQLSVEGRYSKLLCETAVLLSMNFNILNTKTGKKKSTY